MTAEATRNHHSRVLLVEDEFLISDMLSGFLADRGFEVSTFDNAADALAHLIAGSGCDILFTDINLPGGIDGAELAQRARDLRPALPVVYCSGAVRCLDQIDAVPGSTFVPKPYDPNRVCAMLQRLAAEPALASA
jgi:DNA-binding NtrC family response regulator